MKKWEKPLIVVSKCLDNCNCRYNGEGCTCKALEELKEFAELIDICPEEAIGLGTPRNAIRLVGNEKEHFLIDPKTLKDYTKIMSEFAREICIDIEYLKPQGFILRTKSPFCGINDVKIYRSLEKGSASVKGKGIFGEKIYDVFNYLPIEDDGRLKSFKIRENFYIKIFTLVAFKKVYESKNFGELVNFHGNNKLLFMVFSQKLTKEMGQLVSNGRYRDKNNIFDKYSFFLNELLSKGVSYRGYINVFYKILGYFSKELSKEEKNFFLRKVEEFRRGKIPHRVIMTLIEAYAIRFNNKYMLNQSLLEPYPYELLSLDDSGKGIER